MSFDTSTYSEPFWAKSADFVRGRDPLGIQNSSISVYSLLLPGMTNLTLRLRYYGFYLWLIEEYFKLPTTNDFRKSVRGQYNFIRRAELILSYFMVNKFPTEQSVVGSDFANKNFSQLTTQSYYDLALGADKLLTTIKGSVYWDYTSGAFGQYYVGSLMALQLVDSRTEGYFGHTEKGLKLSKVYSESITNDEAKTLFIKRIIEGKLYAEDIDVLMDFSLSKNIYNSSEEDFYIQMLLDNDGEKNKKATGELPQQRKETVILFLQFLSENKDPNSWKNLPIALYSAYQHNSNKNTNEAKLGWYYYYLNELVHFSLEAIFWGMLTEMERKSQTIQTFIENIAQSVTDNEFENVSVSEVISKTTNFEEEAQAYIDNINKEVRNKESISCISEGIFFLLKLYKDTKLDIESLEQYASDFTLFDKNGNALAIFNKYITANSALKFSDFVKNTIRSLINEHTAIAYRKMGNGEKNLLKFIIEDNYLVHIETMKPNFTSPRLRTLYNFSIDLGLISKDGVLSEKANQLISENT